MLVAVQHLDVGALFHFALGDQSALRSDGGDQLNLSKWRNNTSLTPLVLRPFLETFFFFFLRIIRTFLIIHTFMHHFPLVSHSIHLSKHLNLLSVSPSLPSCSAVEAHQAQGKPNLDS